MNDPDPNALKRMIGRANGHSTFIDSAKLAREMFGLGPKSTPELFMLQQANWQLANLIAHPPGEIELIEHRGLGRIKLEIRRKHE